MRNLRSLLPLLAIALMSMAGCGADGLLNLQPTLISVTADGLAQNQAQSDEPVKCITSRNDTVNLSVQATDPEGDTLTYTWSPEDQILTDNQKDATLDLGLFDTDELEAGDEITCTVEISDGTNTISGFVVVEFGSILQCQED